MLLSKFMTSQPRKQTLQYTNFSTSQEAKTMKFGQLIEYDMRNIFLEKLYTKCCGGTISRPFSKKSKLSISLNKWSKFLFRLLSLYAKLRAIDKYWNEAVDHLLLPHVNIFWKKKRGLELVSLSHFPYDFWRDMCIVIVIVQYVHLFFNRLWCN